MLGRFQSTSQNRENQISRYLTVQVKLRFWLDLNSEVCRGTNSKWNFCWIWICSWLKSPQQSGFRLPFNSAFRVSSSTERAVSGNCHPKIEPDTYFVPLQKKGWKIDPHVLNLRSREFSSAQGWNNRTLISHEPLVGSKMCFSKTEPVQY